ncbi:F0F1 ATP synthase subunit delta [Thermosipho ferrireducens]|uniref:ATP synthase subunit delta n=1 Tax=Thermosipho ferrireducens TaxID=2571116 RepID=A0ABX7S6G6_9BACT|nr:F0F1 ATP synthase subunit delta [Thermosipho ferrireducens]QTA37172.1 F0F1 ATP synthase subunit delta [Thermosipho ferrireducens]
MRYSIVASKYVKALLLVAKKYKKEEEYAFYIQLLKELYTMYAFYLNNPTVRVEKHLTFIENLFEELSKKVDKSIKVDSVFFKFVKIIFNNKRQKYIPQMASLYKYAAIESQNKIPVKVTSAYTLTPDEEEAISAFVKKYTGKEAVIETFLDERILAGVILEFAGKKLDVSILGRLEKVGRGVFSLRKG